MKRHGISLLEHCKAERTGHLEVSYIDHGMPKAVHDKN